MIQKLYSLFSKQTPTTVVIKQAEQKYEEPFCKFPCDCKEQLTLFKTILPGEAAVLECDNCGMSWTVYNPTLIIKKTKELPENLQQVWAKLSNES